NHSAPGGDKAECSNCSATHTPLWRRGLNDELNCNTCGLYCKLHKCPRPKTMRNNHGERSRAAPHPESNEVMGQSAYLSPRLHHMTNRLHFLRLFISPAVESKCYNCNTTATPLWRKDDEGKTVCNACGLYFKLHGSSRPISMKSDVIRKRSRHEAHHASIIGGNPPDTPSASPGASRRTSPTSGHDGTNNSNSLSPILAPDLTTQMN
ncbi:glucocorticoid receptor-like protein, partial [Stereum hirsutum FP-91666 SS1]